VVVVGYTSRLDKQCPNTTDAAQRSVAQVIAYGFKAMIVGSLCETKTEQKPESPTFARHKRAQAQYDGHHYIMPEK